jgi:hypothetical protein
MLTICLVLLTYDLSQLDGDLTTAMATSLEYILPATKVCASILCGWNRESVL